MTPRLRTTGRAFWLRSSKWKIISPLLRILDQESKEQAGAVAAAERSLALALTQYQGGVTAYLQVITAQAAALQNETPPYSC